MTIAKEAAATVVDTLNPDDRVIVNLILSVILYILNDYQSYFVCYFIYFKRLSTLFCLKTHIATYLECCDKTSSR